MFSIVTVNLNNREGLRQTLESMLMQSEFNFEWILMDGGSTDGSSDLTHQYPAPFRSTVIREPDQGIYDAMNKGVKFARYGYVMFLNSGDTFISRSSSNAIGAAIEANPKGDLILFGFRQANANRKSRPTWWRFWSLPTSHQAILYRHALLLTHPYDISLKFAGDFEHFLRISSLKLTSVRDPTVIVENEPYGSDKYIVSLEREYAASLKRVLPAFLSRGMVWVKFRYIRFILAIRHLAK